MGFNSLAHAYAYTCDFAGCHEEGMVSHVGAAIPPFLPVPVGWVMVKSGGTNGFDGRIWLYCGRHDNVDLLTLESPEKVGNGGE